MPPAQWAGQVKVNLNLLKGWGGRDLKWKKKKKIPWFEQRNRKLYQPPHIELTGFISLFFPLAYKYNQGNFDLHIVQKIKNKDFLQQAPGIFFFASEFQNHYI